MRKFLSIILALVFICAPLSTAVSANELSVTADGFLYTSNDSGVTIVGYNGGESEVYIPYSVSRVSLLRQLTTVHLKDLRVLFISTFPPQ